MENKFTVNKERVKVFQEASKALSRAGGGEYAVDEYYRVIKEACNQEAKANESRGHKPDILKLTKKFV